MKKQAGFNPGVQFNVAMVIIIIAFIAVGIFGLIMVQYSEEALAPVKGTLLYVGSLVITFVFALFLAFLKRAGDVIKMAYTELNQIFNTVADGMCVVDMNSTVKRVNGAFSLLSGISPEIAEGRRCYEVFPGSTCKTPDCTMARIKAGETRVDLDVEKEKNDGSKVHCSLTATPLLGSNGRLIGVVKHFIDITGRKKVEQEMARLDRLNLVGKMAAVIGHEVRNPMTTVRGLLQIIGRKEEFAGQKANFNLMIEELDRANSIITEFLSLARTNTVDKKMKNINDVLGALFPLIEAHAIKDDKKIEMNLGSVPEILLDDKEIRQLVLNLVRNGLESMPPGGCLTVNTYADGTDTIMSVRDEGSGMESEVLEKIGAPFYTTKENGTGLGLAVCYSIATRHNALIEVESGPQGTTFLVRFRT